MKKFLLILMIGCLWLVGYGGTEVKAILNDDFAKNMSEEEVEDATNDILRMADLIDFINAMEYESEEELFERFDNKKINWDIPRDTSSEEYIYFKIKCGSALLGLSRILTNSPINTLEEYKTKVVNDLLQIYARCDDNKEFVDKFFILNEAWEHFAKVSGW